MSINRAVWELRDWFAKHQIPIEDIEIVFRGEAAYAVESAVKHDLSPELMFDARERPHKGDMELGGVALSFERPKR